MRSKLNKMPNKIRKKPRANRAMSRDLKVTSSEGN
jgi:hypothetical protein